MIYLIIFCLGTIFTSFVGVISYRRPSKSYLYDRSRCENCNKIIPLYLNIPIFSFVLLKGKSKCCNTKIKIKYLFFEIFGGMAFIYIYIKYGLTVNFLIKALEFLILLLIIDIDLKEHNIYIKDVVYVFVFEFIYKILNSSLNINYFKCAILFGIIFYLIFTITKSLGEGDVILAFLVGFFLDNVFDLILLFRNIFIFASISSILLIVVKKKSRKDYIAFSPYIILGLLTVI